MALELKDIRGKVDSDTHRRLSAIAISQGRKIDDLFREAIELFIKEEIRKAHEGKVLLRILGDEGAGGETKGNPYK